MTEELVAKLSGAVEALSETYSDADVFFYSGPIERSGYEEITNLCRWSDPRKNAVLILATYGGDADAAYRIARALRHNYARLFLFVLRECKSAGTLLAIGATGLIISDRGELGPLDVQLSKSDEIFERNSGLDIFQSLQVMQNQAMEAFRSYLLDIKLGSGITLKTAAEIATKLAVGLFAPVYGQLDPVKLGEVQRAIAIAQAYGERLNLYDNNLQEGALGLLISAYPSHGFVIDRKEARSLFKEVRAATPEESFLGEWLCASRPMKPNDQPFVINVAQQLVGGNKGEQECARGKDTTVVEGDSGGPPKGKPEGGRNAQRGDKKPKEISVAKEQSDTIPNNESTEH